MGQRSRYSFIKPAPPNDFPSRVSAAKASHDAQETDQAVRPPRKSPATAESRNWPPSRAEHRTRSTAPQSLPSAIRHQPQATAASSPTCSLPSESEPAKPEFLARALHKNA